MLKQLLAAAPIFSANFGCTSTMATFFRVEESVSMDKFIGRLGCRGSATAFKKPPREEHREVK